MRKLKVLLIAGIVCIGVIHFNSCKKQSDDPTKTELLTGKWWKMSAQTISPGIDMDGNGTLDTDIYALMETCRRDDLTKFNTGGTITNDQKTLCTYETVNTNGGTWKWNSDETQLTMTPPAGSTDSAMIIKLLELTSTSLKVSMTQTESGTTYTYTMTLTAQ